MSGRYNREEETARILFADRSLQSRCALGGTKARHRQQRSGRGRRQATQEEEARRFSRSLPENVNDVQAFLVELLITFILAFVCFRSPPTSGSRRA